MDTFIYFQLGSFSDMFSHKIIPSHLCINLSFSKTKNKKRSKSVFKCRFWAYCLSKYTFMKVGFFLSQSTYLKILVLQIKLRTTSKPMAFFSVYMSGGTLFCEVECLNHLNRQYPNSPQLQRMLLLFFAKKIIGFIWERKEKCGSLIAGK